MLSCYSPQELNVLRDLPPYHFQMSDGTFVYPLDVSFDSPSSSAVDSTSDRANKARSSIDIAMAFATYRTGKTAAQFVIPNTSSGQSSSVHWLPSLNSQNPFKLLRVHSCLAHHVKYDASICCFNLYPATDTDVQINHFIWKVAQAGEYDPVEGNILLQNNVLSLSMPYDFYHLLRDVTEEQLKHGMLEVLALIAEDEPPDGFAMMKSELEPSIWINLEKYMHTGEDEGYRINSETTEGEKVRTIVETLLRFCYLSPWKIQIYASYITPEDFHNAFKQLRNPMLGPKSRVSVLAQESNAQNGTNSVGERPHLLKSALTNGCAQNRVFWKLFQDWRRYRNVFVLNLGLNAQETAYIALESILSGTHEEAWRRAESVLGCWSSNSGLFGTLPKQIVFKHIAPRVLYSSCTARRKQIDK